MVEVKVVEVAELVEVVELMEVVEVVGRRAKVSYSDQNEVSPEVYPRIVC